MTSQAETVELLVRKANFQPHVALAVVEAIDNSIKESQFVTVPMLDARFAELKAMIEVSNERLLKELTTTRGQFSADLAATRGQFSADLAATRGQFSADLAATRGQFSAELATTRGQFSAELATTSGHLSKEIANSKGELARWVLLVMLGSVAISTVASEVTYAIHQGR
jgi:hypothetical protein